MVSMADEANSDKILWFVAGVSIGAAVAILFAPAAGSEIRATIAKKTGESRDALSDSGKEMIDRGREMIERARNLADQAAEMFEKGRKLVENTAANLQQG
jgi:gas vesicle protein